MDPVGELLWKVTFGMIGIGALLALRSAMKMDPVGDLLWKVTFGMIGLGTLLALRSAILA